MAINVNKKASLYYLIPLILVIGVFVGLYFFTNILSPESTGGFIDTIKETVNKNLVISSSKGESGSVLRDAVKGIDINDNVATIPSFVESQAYQEIKADNAEKMGFTETDKSGKKIKYNLYSDTIDNEDGTYTATFYSYPKYFDKVVEVKETNNGLVLSVDGTDINIILEARTASGSKSMNDIKNENPSFNFDVITDRTYSTLDTDGVEITKSQIKFSWDLKNIPESLKQELVSYAIVVNSENGELILDDSGFLIKNANIYISILDIENSGFTIKRSGDAFIITDGEKSIKETNLYLDPTVVGTGASQDYQVNKNAQKNIDGASIAFDDGSGYIGLLYWDVNSLPFGVNVTAATIQVYYSIASSNDVITAYPIMSGQMSNPNWFNYTGSSPWNAPGLGAPGSGEAYAGDYNNTAGYYATHSSGSGVQTLNVANWYRETLKYPGTQPDYGWLLLNQDSGNNFIYGTEESDASKRPKLTITYSFPEPEVLSTAPENATLLAVAEVTLETTMRIDHRSPNANMSAIYWDLWYYNETLEDYEVVWFLDGVEFNSTSPFGDINGTAYGNLTINSSNSYLDSMPDGQYEWYPGYEIELEKECSPSCSGGENTVTISAQGLFGGEFEAYYFTIDTAPPVITYENPTPSDAASVTSTVTINVSISDATAIDTCYVELDDGSLTNYTMTVSGDYCNYTFSGLSEGIYNYKVYANDSAGHWGNTSTQSFNVDATPPAVSIIYPINGATYMSISALNYTASDNSLDSCWYSADGGTTNTTITCGTNVTGLSASEGSNTWTIYANDTVGNQNSTSVTFTKDSQAPSISIVYPATNDNWYYTNIEINYTVSDALLDSCWWNVNNGANTTLPGCANITGQTWNQGQHNVTIYVNDSAGNVNSSVRRFNIDTGYPLINWGTGVAADNAVLSQSNIFMNVTYTESNLQKFDYFWAAFPTACTSGSSFPTALSYFDKTGLADGKYNYCVRAQDYGGLQNTTSQRTITIDANSPTVSITSPASNGIYTQDTGLNLSWNANDAFIDSCWWSVNGGSNTSITCNQTLTGQTWDEGSNSVTFYANDTFGHVGSATRQFYVDTIAPTFTFGGGVFTYEDGGHTTDNFFNINVTCSEESGNHTLHLFNETGLVLSVDSTTQTSDCSFVWGVTDLDNEGWRYYNVTGYDGAGNYNFSETRSVLYDSAVPTMTINTPADNANLSSSNVEITFTAADATRDVCWSTDDGGATNTSRDCGTGAFTEAYAEGTNSVTVYVNDSANNVVSDTVNFNIDTITPLIEYGTNVIASGLNLSQNYIYINVTATEANEANITFSLFNSTGTYNVTTLVAGSRTINFTSLPNDDYYFNVTINDYFGHSNSTGTRTVLLDTNAPNVVQTNPADDNYTSSTDTNFTVNITDNEGIKNATIYIYNESDDLINETTINYGGDTTDTVFSKVITLVEGVLKWFVKAFDWAGNEHTTDNRTVTVDLTDPSIEYNSNTDADNIWKQTGDIFINITATDTNKNLVRWEFNGVNETFQSNDGDVYWENKTGLSTGSYTFYAWINDLAGRYAATASRTVNIDLENPSVNLISPEGGTSINYNETILMNFTATDTNLESCWWNIDGEANQSITCGTSTTFNTSEGSHTIYAYANDSSGRVGSDTASFDINLAAPSIVNLNPANGTWFNYNTNIQVSYLPADTDLDSCMLYLKNGEWHINQTHNPVSGVQDIFYLNISDGYWEWNILCNDSAAQETWGDSEMNRALNVDGTKPLIEFTTGTLPDKTNTTNNFIFVNVSVTETNEDTIIFKLYNDLFALQNQTSSTSGLRELTWRSLVDGIYYYSVSINDSAGNSNQTETRQIVLDDTPPEITVNSPRGDTANNNSIDIDIDVTDNLVGVDSCYYNVIHTNGTVYIDNTTIANCNTENFALPGGDEDYVVKFVFNDTSGNTDSTEVALGIRTIAPAIVLDEPDDNEYYNRTNDIEFLVTPTDAGSNMDSCQLWADFGDGWHLNQTKSSLTNGAQFSFDSLNLTESNFTYNVWCNDSLGNGMFHSSNYTFTNDITFPEVAITTTNGTSVSTTFSLEYNISDTYIDSCNYQIDDGGLFPLDCNATSKSLTLSAGTYDITIYGEDFATNENTSMITLTTSAPAAPSGGGGTPNAPPETVVKVIGANFSWTVSTDALGNKYDYIMKDGESRTGNLLFQNLKNLQVFINVTCEDIEGDLCQYVTIAEPQSVVLAATANAQAEIKFTLQLPGLDENEEPIVPDGVYDFKLVATDQDNGVGDVAVRVNKGFNILTIIVNKFIGVTSFDLTFLNDSLDDVRVWNWILLILPFLIMTPLFLLILGKWEYKYYIALLMPFALSAVIFFLV